MAALQTMTGILMDGIEEAALFKSEGSVKSKVCRVLPYASPFHPLTATHADLGVNYLAGSRLFIAKLD